MFGEQDHDIQARSSLVQTVTSGPVGFVYLLTEQLRNRRQELARDLVCNHHVPMTVLSAGIRRAKVFTAEGTFALPDDAIRVFGADHPFLEDIIDDTIRLANHQNSGDIVLIDWTNHRDSTSFVLQNGAHAGPGIDETHGFALLPSDTRLPVSEKRFLRPNDLRLAGLQFLGRDSDGDTRRRRSQLQMDRVRLMTYNVHACVGMDGQLSAERVARVISQSGADIVCLQELDVFRHRSGNRDQAHAIAQHLEMSHQFHPAWHLEEEQFGNAILTRFPMQLVQAKPLHHHKKDRSRRSALWVEVDIGDELSVQVINTHLSIFPTEQKIQAAQLLEEWIHPASLLGPVILCGDFNAGPKTVTSKTIRTVMSDVESFDTNPTRSTLFSSFPISRVDHIFVSGGLHATNNQVIQTRLAKIASDHLPLVSDLRTLNKGQLNEGPEHPLHQKLPVRCPSSALLELQEIEQGRKKGILGITSRKRSDR